MITDIRPFSQQLSNPKFDNPKDLVAWMGAIQAQDYNMSKWAVGIRLKSGNIPDIEDALKKGEILRTHVMRPTWHLVTAEDIRWMLKLSAGRARSAIQSYSKSRGISEDTHIKCNSLIEKILEGNKSLTKQEIGEKLIQTGIIPNMEGMNHVMFRAEADGIICSGVDKNKKATYALLEERVPPAKELHREDALAKLARNYFRSHSPASLQDFAWWSGLPITEARQAINSISPELVADKFAAENLLVHESYNNAIQPGEGLFFLPSYDEYLISYKDRTSVLDPEHHPKAFSNNGIFHPVIMYKGKIVGNWRKSIKNGELNFETSFFDSKLNINKNLLFEAENRYRDFLLKINKK
ncbi:MAG: winged helix DNA-binding domain-containing protein [Dysgonamonadaceae bacterium]|jgi:hypothetical protein|nr:winged helix DNA-binding domain-containing protein [Dysgonamonadaceae bacterium]